MTQYETADVQHPRMQPAQGMETSPSMAGYFGAVWVIRRYLQPPDLLARRVGAQRATTMSEANDSVGVM